MSVPPTYPSSWEPLNLAAVEERPKIAPDLGGLGLLYPGKRHVFSGPPESAKTLFAYIAAIQIVREGGTALLIDFEMGRWDTRDRLRELGACDEELERILYVEPEEPATRELVETLITKHEPTLAIIDAAAGAFDLQGLDDNKRADVERFGGVYVRAFFACGIATIVLDHVAKDSKNRGRFAIGSERKVGGADVHLGFEPSRPLVRGGRGFYAITTHKDRLGHLRRPTAAKLELASDPETHMITWKLSEPGRVDTTSEWRPTGLMEKVSRFLETRREPISQATVEGAVPGTAKYVRQALDYLVLDGYAREEGGPRGARLFRSEIQYRETTSSATSSTQFGGDLVGANRLRSAESDLVGTSSPISSADSVGSSGCLTPDDDVLDSLGGG